MCFAWRPRNNLKKYKIKWIIDMQWYKCALMYSTNVLVIINGWKSQINWNFKLLKIILFLEILRNGRNFPKRNMLRIGWDEGSNILLSDKYYCQSINVMYYLIILCKT